MVMRQTSYSYEECEKKLDENNNDYIKVIKEFYGIKEHSQKELTINQGIIKEIRTLMDNANNNFRIKQEIQKGRKEYYENREKLEKIEKKKKLNKIIEDSESED